MASIFLTSIFEAFAQSSIQIAQRYNSTWHLIVAMCCYVIVTICLYIAYQYQGVGMVNALWSGMTIAMMLAIGYFFFGERLSKPEWIGFGFIVVGLVIINTCCSNKPRVHYQ